MHESDKELMDKILKEMEDVQVPESLSPENIEAMLVAHDAEKGLSSENTVSLENTFSAGEVPGAEEVLEAEETPETKDTPSPEKVTPIKRKKRSSIYRLGTFVAACLVLLVGLSVWRNVLYNKLQYLEEVTEEAIEADDAADIMETDDAAEMVEGPAKDYSVTDSKDSDQTGSLEMAEGYEQIYHIFEEVKERYEVVYEEEESHTQGLFDALGIKFGSSDKVETEAAVTEDAMKTESAATESSNGATSDYSTTNTREENVDEGDVVKTDGRYLYILKEKRTEVCIVDTQAGKASMENIATIEPKGLKRIQEIYITEDQNHLVLVGENWEEEVFDDDFLKSEEDAVEDVAKSDVLFCGSYNNMKSKTIVVTYDLTNHSEPKEAGRVNQTGYYENSRMADGCLYIFSEYDVPFEFLKKDQPETYIPCINDNLMACSDVCLPVCQDPSRYLVVTSVKMSSPSVICDSKAFLSDWGQLYVSDKNIYYYESKYDSKKQQDYTIIRSIGYKDGELTTGHKGRVTGSIDDSFSIDEYNGYLRVITTVYNYKADQTTNEVNVLNHELDRVGGIKDLAKGEIVYSARMMGNTGYFVTFRQTDPLFSVDFSDPKHPKIIGKLKIPGFSEYLHPWGEGKLLGIGMQADEETGMTDGLKLSMFDISDPSDVKEEDVYLLDNYYYSEALYDYKSVLASNGKNLIGFACENGDGTDYLLFSYDEKDGFSMKMQEEVNGYGWFGTRGVYLNDSIYIVRGNVIEAYSLKDFDKIDDLIL